MEIRELANWLDKNSEQMIADDRGKDTVFYCRGLSLLDKRLWYCRVFFDGKILRYMYDMQCQYRAIQKDYIKGLKDVFTEGRWGRDMEILNTLDTSGAEAINDHITLANGVQQVVLDQPDFESCNSMTFLIDISLNNGTKLNVELTRSDTGGWVVKYKYADTEESELVSDLDRIDKNIAEWLSTSNL